MSNYHKSVLLKEIINFLNIKPGSKYIDATLGGSGHTRLILESGGQVLGIDTDQDAISYANENFHFPISNFQLKLAKGNFRNIDELARVNGFENVAGILFDLGVSGHQLEKPERGFSFIHDAPLDMRMDRDLQVKAADLLNILTKGDLYALFKNFGEERFAKRIATHIAESRRIKKIQTTQELEALVKECVPGYKTRINPATRVFQALRIAVNDELGSLKEALPKALRLLDKKGRIAIISFHSLEDRIVKHKFKEWEDQGRGTILTKKLIIPGEKELSENPRSRSAKLRVFEKF